MIIKCWICGKHFQARRIDARYCSNACRQKAYRRKKGSSSTMEEITAKRLFTKRHTGTMVECLFCGYKFSIDGTQGGKLYCSASCKQKAYRKRVAERNAPTG